MVLCQDNWLLPLYVYPHFKPLCLPACLPGSVCPQGENGLREGAPELCQRLEELDQEKRRMVDLLGKKQHDAQQDRKELESHQRRVEAQEKSVDEVREELEGVVESLGLLEVDRKEKDKEEAQAMEQVQASKSMEKSNEEEEHETASLVESEKKLREEVEGVVQGLALLAKEKATAVEERKALIKQRAAAR